MVFMPKVKWNGQPEVIIRHNVPHIDLKIRNTGDIVEVSDEVAKQLLRHLDFELVEE